MLPSNLSRLSMLNRFQKIVLLLCGLALILPLSAGYAQSAARLQIVSFGGKFPYHQMVFDAYDANGAFLADLTPETVRVLENERQIPPDTLELRRAPLQLVVAFNHSLALATRDTVGMSRYEKINAIFRNWVAALPPDADFMSLVDNNGAQFTHVSNGEWLRRFGEYNPEVRSFEPSLVPLSAALDILEANPATAESKKVIFFVTPHLEGASEDTFNSLLERAEQAGVRVFVWFVDSPSYFTHSTAQRFQDMVTRTAGRYLTFSGAETLPTPEEWLAPLREFYTLTYTSRLTTSGVHTISIQAQTPLGTLTAPGREVEYTILSPSPIFVVSPDTLTRQNPDDIFNFDSFEPRSQTIEILIEFPDGQPRPLQRSTLYVNGVLYAENTQEPFDTFTLDLTPYRDAKTELSLTAEVVDMLGMSQTIAAPKLTVNVIQPPNGIYGWFLQNRDLVVALSIVLTGIILVSIVFASVWRRAGAQRNTRKLEKDPITQPVRIQQTQKARTAQAGALGWLKRAPAPVAYLARLTSDGQPAPGDPLPLTGSEMTFGTDPTQSTHILDHAALSPLHARLRIEPNGECILSDQNSLAGTWVNYENVTRDGVKLRHGDILHFGPISYRFVNKQSAQTAVPKIEEVPS
jgi:hypothetical protein